MPPPPSFDDADGPEQVDPGESSLSLPAPSAAASLRAKPLFDRLVREMRGASPAAAPVPSPAVGGGRRYDVALSLVRLEPGAIAPVLIDDGEETEVAAGETTRTQVRRPSARAHAVEHAPARPPQGAPTVRPSVRQPTLPQPLTEQLLEITADTALLRTEADGAMAFDIAFKDDVFDDMACTVTVKDGRATAIFRVRDDNTRRLLEAEAPRLRDGFEGRGLRVQEVRVVVEGK